MNYSLAIMGADESYQAIYDQNIKLSKGMSVKLIFIFNYMQNRNINAERLWVTIVDIDGDRLTGVLDNDPTYADIEEGDRINFLRQNIFDVYMDKEEI